MIRSDAWRTFVYACAVLMVSVLAITAIASPEDADTASANQHDAQVESSGGHSEADAAAPAPLTERSVVTQWFIAIIVDLGIISITVGIVLLLWRILRGPHLADRVLAADAMALHVVGLVILLALRMGTEVFFDAALVVAIIGFASTLAFAQYIGNRRRMSAA